MTHQFIYELLEKENESPVLLEDCVLNIRQGRSIIYLLWGDTDYQQRELEICYADNHDLIWEGTIKTNEDLENEILKTIK